MYLTFFFGFLCYLLNDLVAIDGSTECANGPIGKFAKVYRLYEWPSMWTGQCQKIMVLGTYFILEDLFERVDCLSRTLSSSNPPILTMACIIFVHEIFLPDC